MSDVSCQMTSGSRRALEGQGKVGHDPTARVLGGDPGASCAELFGVIGGRWSVTNSIMALKPASKHPELNRC